MAAIVLRCDGCGVEFVALRSHRRWCSDACRMAHTRARPAVVPEHEPLIVAAVHAGLRTPEDAILWVVCPDEMLASTRTVRFVGRRKVAA